MTKLIKYLVNIYSLNTGTIFDGYIDYPPQLKEKFNEIKTFTNGRSYYTFTMDTGSEVFGSRISGNKNELTTKDLDKIVLTKIFHEGFESKNIKLPRDLLIVQFSEDYLKDLNNICYGDIKSNLVKEIINEENGEETYKVEYNITGKYTENGRKREYKLSNYCICVIKNNIIIDLK